MNSKRIGIEDARKTLGPLVDEANSGVDIVLTRHGKPIARIAPIDGLPTPSIAEHLATFHRMSTVHVSGDALGLDDRDPAGWDLARAKVAAEAKPFARLIADIDAFFGDDLGDALTGPEAAEAETEVRRIIAENLASAIVRLTLTAAGGAQVEWTAADTDTLQQLASIAIQRAADLRFVEVVSPAAKAAA